MEGSWPTACAATWSSMTHPNEEAVEAVAPLIKALQALEVTYYIGGSLASTAFGLPRSTVDVDVVVLLRLEHVEPLLARLQGLYYVEAEAIRCAIQSRTSFNLIYLPKVYKVDVFVPKDRPMDRAAMQRVRRARLDEADPSTELPFASPEDIILNKLEWYRMGDEVSERQWLDVLNVMRVQGEALEDAYLDHWAAELEVSDLLDRARAAARMD